MKLLKVASVFVLAGTILIDQIKSESMQEKPLVVVVIDTKKVADSSLRGKEIQKRMHDEQTAATTNFPAMQGAIRTKEESIGKLQESYNEKIKSLDAKAKMISEEARYKAADEIQSIRQQIEELATDRERLINKFNQEAKKAEQRLELFFKKEMTPFEIECNQIIDQAKEMYGWDIVERKEMLLSCSARVDKTSVIIDLLDAAETKRKESKLAEKKATDAVKKAA